MVGEEYLRLDGLCCLDQLVGGHGVGLVAGEESDVDVLDGCHLGNVLGITGDVDAQSVDGKDVSVVSSLGVELGAPLADVIGGNGLDGVIYICSEVLRQSL